MGVGLAARALIREPRDLMELAAEKCQPFRKDAAGGHGQPFGSVNDSGQSDQLA